jgi:hypothetical protein
MGPGETAEGRETSDFGGRLVQRAAQKEGETLAGYVYFIQAPINGFIKIGWTAEHPTVRLRYLRHGSPVPLEPVAMRRGTRKLEAELHARFAHLRAHGEWFRPGEDLLDFIREKGLKFPLKRQLPPSPDDVVAERQFWAIAAAYEGPDPERFSGLKKHERMEVVQEWRVAEAGRLRAEGLPDWEIAERLGIREWDAYCLRDTAK